jgi:hypothetical protein
LSVARLHSVEGLVPTNGVVASNDAIHEPYDPLITFRAFSIGPPQAYRVSFIGLRYAGSCSQEQPIGNAIDY